MISDIKFQLGPKHFVKKITQIEEINLFLMIFAFLQVEYVGPPFYNSNDNRVKLVMLISELYLFM